MNASGHILVAEDDPTDAFFFQRAFTRAGLPVTLHFVRDGQEVIDYLPGRGPVCRPTAYPLPQLVLLDLKMPRLDGSMCSDGSGNSRSCTTCWSSSSAPRTTKDISRAYDLGANWYLVKPHSMEELTALVGRFKKYWLEGATTRPQGRVTAAPATRRARVIGNACCLGVWAAALAPHKTVDFPLPGQIQRGP